MNDIEPNLSATPNPPIMSSSGNQPQDTLLQRGAFDPPFTPGTLGRLDKYEILRFLGEGSMGQVYLAREPVTGVQVAIKIIKPQMAADPQSRHRFLTEARHMSGLSHPHILSVKVVSDREEGYYYVMPYVEGGNLRTFGKPGEALPEQQLLPIAQQIAGALAYAHTRGIIHRDLKPDNVLLDKQGNAALSDFGLVRTVFNDSMVDPTASHLEGTAPYMSPAVAQGEAEDTRCDIYAFGAVLYELLTGQPPYTGRTPQMILDQVIKGPPPPISTVNPKANPALVQIAEGCMARELRNRYASMADVVADLNRMAKGKAPFGPHRQQHGSPKIAAMLVGVLAVVGVIGIAAYHFLTDDTEVVPPGQKTGRGILEGRALSRPSSGEGQRHQESPVETPAALPAPTDERDFSCTATTDAVTIVKYTGDGGAVTIPNTISGLPVTAIKNEAFLNCTNLTYVAIPNSVTNIGNGAFKNCARMAKITIGKSVLIIGNDAFSGCTNLTSITIPATVVSVHWGSTFSGCSSLSSIAVDILNPTYTCSKDGVVFNKEKTVLIRYPMGRAGSYIIPNGVTDIGVWAFSSCANLTGITIPATVTGIGKYAFTDCSRLNAITLDAANPSYSSSADGVVFNREKTFLVSYPNGRAGSYVIPSTVTQIAAGAFHGSVKLTSLTIPPGVKTLDVGTFRNCTVLTNVTIPGSVTRLGGNFWEGGVFEGCTELVSVTIPHGVTSLEGRAFKDCTSLTNVAIPDSVTIIGGDPYEGGAFMRCIQLISVTIPNSVKTIGIQAFAACTNLSTVTIGNGVTNIEGWAFGDCANLVSVYFKGDAPDGSSNGWSVFANNNKATVYYLPGTKGWGKEFGGRPTALWSPPPNCPFACTVTNGAITIAKYTGDGGALTIPETINGLPVTRIGARAFRDCANLTSVTIPGCVTNIGYMAFRSCVGLTNITFGAGVAIIGTEAFSGCSKLTHLRIPASVTSIANNSFVGCSAVVSVLVDGLNPIYSSSSDGVMFNKEKTVLLYYPSDRAGNYVIPDGVTGIDGGAFQGCTGLTNIMIPYTVSNIAPSAFTYSSRLKAITVDDANPAYSSSADGVMFSKDKTRLVRYPSGKAGNYVMPDTVTTIGKDAFAGSSRLISVTIPNSVTAIEMGAFYDCASLTNLAFGNSLTTIGYGAFGACSNLNSIALPSSVTKIAQWAFGQCSSLTGIGFKGNAPYLSKDVFLGANKATVYYLPGTTGWGKEFGGRPTAVWDAQATNAGSPAIPLRSVQPIPAQ